MSDDRRGLPSFFHESLIDKYCNNQGFSRYGFNKMAKVILLRDYSEFKLELKQLYDKCRDSKTTEQANKPLNSALKKVIRNVSTHQCYDCEYKLTEDCSSCKFCGEDRESCQSFYGCDWLSCDSATDFMSEMTERFNFIPDAWRFSGNTIDIIEICHNSPVPLLKLVKMAWLHDLFYCHFGENLEFNVYEYHIKTNSMVKHDLSLIFNLTEIGIYNGINEEEVMLGYHCELKPSNSGGYNFEVELIH